MAATSSPRLRRSTARKDLSYAEQSDMMEHRQHDEHHHAVHEEIDNTASSNNIIDGKATSPFIPLMDVPTLPYPSVLTGPCSLPPSNPPTIEAQHEDINDDGEAEEEDNDSNYTASRTGTPATRPCSPSLNSADHAPNHPHPHPHAQQPQASFKPQQQQRKTSHKSYHGPQEKRKRPKAPLDKIHFCSADETCKKAFARKSDLQRHERIHRCEKPYQCTMCGKCFIQTSALKVHERSHTGEKPFQWKCFSDTSSLVRHRRVHTGERPYVCDFGGCPFAFCRKSSLIKHQMREHGYTTQVIVPQTHRARDPPAPKPPKTGTSNARRVTLPKITQRLPHVMHGYDGAQFPMSANPAYAHPSMQMQMQMGLGLGMPMSAPMHNLPFSMQMQMQMHPHYPHSRAGSLSMPPQYAQMTQQGGQMGGISPGMPPVSGSREMYPGRQIQDGYFRGSAAGLPHYTVNSNRLHPHAQGAMPFSQASSGYATPLESPGGEYFPQQQEQRAQAYHPNGLQAPMADPAGLIRPFSAAPLGAGGNTIEHDHHMKRSISMGSAPYKSEQPTFPNAEAADTPMLTVDTHTQSAGSNNSVSPTDIQPIQHTLPPPSPFGSKAQTTFPEIARLHPHQRAKVETYSPSMPPDVVAQIPRRNALTLAPIPGIDDNASDLAMAIGYAQAPHSAAPRMYSNYEIARSHSQQYMNGMNDGTAAGLTPMSSNFSASLASHQHGANTGTDGSFISPATSISMAHSERRPSLAPSHYRMFSNAQCGPSAMVNHNQAYYQQQKASYQQTSGDDHSHVQQGQLTPGIHEMPFSAPPHMTFDPTAYA